MGEEVKEEGEVEPQAKKTLVLKGRRLQGKSRSKSFPRTQHRRRAWSPAAVKGMRTCLNVEMG
jgi:hypothetical protein